MTLDEIITCYRECGPVVAKLSLTPEDEFPFKELVEREPGLLEVFSLNADAWVHYLGHYPEFAHLADLSEFTPEQWLAVGRQHPEFLERIDLHSFPESAWENDGPQWELRRYAEDYRLDLHRVPIQYLNDRHLAILLRTEPEVEAYLPHDMVVRGKQIIADDKAKAIAQNMMNIDLTVTFNGTPV